MDKLYIVFFFLTTSLIAQQQLSVDSLITVTQNPKMADTSRVLAYTDLVNHYMYSNKDSTLYYSKELFKFAEEKDLDYGYFKAHYSKAFYFFTSSSFDSVIHQLETALHYAKKMEAPEMVGEVHSKLSGVYSMLGQKDKALEYAQESLIVSRENENWIGVGHAYLNLGNIHFYNNEYNLALKDFQKVDSILSIHNPKDVSLGNAISNIGLIFFDQDQYDKAGIYFNRARTLFDEMEYAHGSQVVKAHLGKLKLKVGEYEEAVKYLEETTAYFEQIGDQFKTGENYNLLAKALFEVDRKGQAFEFLDKARQLKLQIQDTLGLITNLLATSDMRLSNKEPQQSLKLAQEALMLSEKLSSLMNQEVALKYISESYAALNNYKDSYLTYKKYLVVNDSLLKIRNLEQSQEIEAKYQTEKKEREIALLKSESELAEAKQKNQRNLLLGGIALTSIAGLSFFFLYRNRQKTTRKLQELDTAKSNFFANISHEFRTPLTLISGPVEKQLVEENLSEDSRRNLEMVQRNSQRLLNLVDQLLDLSKLESGKMTLKVQEGNPASLLRALAISFQHKASTEQISYEFSVTEMEGAWFDADALEKIVVNLLANAFKYVTKNGRITLHAQRDHDSLLLKVENDGQITGDGPLEDIFLRFHQKDEHQEGVGVGLALVKELVTLHYGTITVVNTPQQSVLFTVNLPIHRNAFSEAAIDTSEAISNKHVLPSVETPLKSETTETETKLDEDAPILLIVEDHKEIRDFVRDSFKDHYQVVEAIHGEDGIAKAIECIPDVIISDIMMPKVSGLELCKTLKTDERTSHIPIILLTAKAEEQSQYEGLELGADDYILKPFKTKWLQTRVNNLVASRKQLQQRYSQEVILKPKNITISKVDEQFIEKVQMVLDEELTNPDFSAEAFSNKVGMSRMQLHRKLKALTGLTTSEFVRAERLKVAATLLKQRNVQVAEVCYQVGFNSPSYFSKCFKEAYGCLPSEYAQKEA